MDHQKADFVNIPSINYAQLATVFGGCGFVVKTSDQLRQALQMAKESTTFSILDVHISPEDVSPALQGLSDLFTKTLKG